MGCVTRLILTIKYLIETFAIEAFFIFNSIISNIFFSNFSIFGIKVNSNYFLEGRFLFFYFCDLNGLFKDTMHTLRGRNASSEGCIEFLGWE